MERRHVESKKSCQFTIKFRHASHSNCYQFFPRKSPVLKHNESNYDFIIVIRYLVNEFNESDLRNLVQNL